MQEEITAQQIVPVQPGLLQQREQKDGNAHQDGEHTYKASNTLAENLSDRFRLSISYFIQPPFFEVNISIEKSDEICKNFSYRAMRHV